MPEKSNLDVEFGRLDERFKALEKKVETSTTNIISEIQDLKTNLSTRVSNIEQNKLDKEEFLRYQSDLELRTRANTRFTDRVMGVILLINFFGFAGFVYFITRIS